MYLPRGIIFRGVLSSSEFPMHSPDVSATAAATPYSSAPAIAPAQAAALQRSRIAAIDMLRGLVILLMLVDHVREAIYLHMQVSDPIDVAATEPALFFTRLSAHLCAPVFVFLTGLSAWLYAHPALGVERPASDFLFKRGLLLVVLELTLVNFAWAGDLPPKTVWLQVIWAIGISMIVLSLLLWLRVSYRALAALGLLIVFGHNLLTPISFQPDEFGYSLWTLLHDRAFLVADGPVQVKVTYPVLPWIGVILLGYVAGPLYSRAFSSEARAAMLIKLGVGCLVLLAVLRGFNIYGETLPWVAGGDFVHTLMSWLNFTKYPPSLDFLLFTLGVSFLLLNRFEALDNRASRALVIFGGAPMFFYVLHLYVLLVLQRLAVATVGANHGARFGVDDVYWIWIVAAVLAVALYFPCRAFSRYKRTSTRAWVRYF
jgi:uncharacterized membrane protein